MLFALLIAFWPLGRPGLLGVLKCYMFVIIIVRVVSLRLIASQAGLDPSILSVLVQLSESALF